MKAINELVIVFLLLAAFSCSKQEATPQINNRFHIQGSWALYETRQETTTGVEVKQISTAGPVQGLTFLPSGQLYKGKKGDDLSYFANWSYYQVDSTQAGLQLRLSTTPESTKKDYSVGLAIQGDRLTITPPCNSGCYFKFARTFLTD